MDKVNTPVEPAGVCPSRAELLAFHLGELAEAQILTVGAHLTACPRCEQQVRQLESLTDPVLSRLRRPGELRSIPGGYAVLPAWTGPAPEIPGYEMLDLLGHGGMGLVWKARHRRLDRLVALKCLRADSARDLERFQAEAQAVARLAHPNIVEIFEVGEWQGQPFLTLEFVDGGTLAEHLTGKPQDARASALLVQTLARAVHYAHTRGIVHRDLKPANVLVQIADCRLQNAEGSASSAAHSALFNLQSAIPKIADFGIAKHLQASGPTREGDIIGTACYMAPEQAVGRAAAIGPAGDIYSLGVILYELLTGRVPLQGLSDLETVLLVQNEEPVPPRQLQPSLPRDLETICLKCLEKEPGKRYESAAALAEDLHRLLAGEPVRARRIGIGERGVKWVKRRPAVAALLAVSAAATFSLIVGILVYNAGLGAALRDARENLDKAKLADQEKTRQLAIAFLREAQARRNSGQVGRRFESLEALGKALEHFRALGQLDEQRTLELRNEAIACLALTDLKPGKERIPEPGWSRPLCFDPTLQYYAVTPTAGGDSEVRDVRRGQLSVRRATDDQEVALLPGFGVPVAAARFSPDGRYLAADYEWRQCDHYVWDLRSRQAILKVPQVEYWTLSSFSPDSRLLALCRPDSSVRIYELPSAATWKDLPLGLKAEGVHFHPGDRQLAVFKDHIVQLRDLNGGGEIARFQHPGLVYTLAWRSDGKVFATGCSDHNIYLWDVANPAGPLRTLKGHVGAVVGVGFNHGGDLLLSDSQDSTTRLWDPMTEQQLFSMPGGLCFLGADDRELGDGWEVATGLECRTFHGPSELKWVTISPKGRLMASASVGGVRLWDLEATREGDKELATLPVGSCTRAQFDPNGESLITDGSAGLQRWPITPDPETRSLRIGPPQSLLLSARAPLLFADYDPDFTLSGDGRTVAHSPQRGLVLLFDPENPRRKTIIESPALRFPTFSPDGRWVATGNWHGRGVKVWDAQTGKPAHDLDLGNSKEGTAWPAFSPDGNWLVIGTFAEYRFWEVGSWQEKKDRLPRANAAKWLGWIVFSPDGKMLAIRHSMNEVRLVDPATGRQFARLPTAWGPYGFSPDGSRLVTSSGSDGVFQVWDLRLIRRELAEMGLDWDRPPYPQAGAMLSRPPKSPVLHEISEGRESMPPSERTTPLRVQVLSAEPLPPSKELDAEAYFQRGLLLVQLRHSPWGDLDRVRALNPKRLRWDEVRDACTQVIERNPEDARAYHLRAHTHEWLGQWEQALAEHSRAIKLAPQSLDYLVCRGRAYLHTGQTDKAEEDFRKAGEQRPGEANALAFEIIASPNPLDRERSLALELAKQATRQVPGEAMHWSTLGAAYYWKGDGEAALQALEEAKKRAPGKHLGFNAYFRALCYEQLGDPAKARDYYDRAVRWYEENLGKLSTLDREEVRAVRAVAEALRKRPPLKP